MAIRRPSRRHAVGGLDRALILEGGRGDPRRGREVGSMTMSPRSGAGGVQRSPQGGLAEVLDLILDRGLVIDVFAKVSLVGIEIVTIDARIVVASVDTYLRFAD